MQDPFDEFVSILKRHDCNNLSFDEMAQMFGMIELGLRFDTLCLIAPRLYAIPNKRELLDDLLEFLDRLLASGLERRNRLVDRLLDAHLKSLHGRSLSEDGLFALVVKKDDEGEDFDQLLSAKSYAIHGSSFPSHLVADSVKRRGCSNGRNFVTLALDTKRLSDAPNNFEALYTWLTEIYYDAPPSGILDLTSAKNVRNLDITYRIISEGPFTIQRFVERYFSTNSRPVIQNIITVAGPQVCWGFRLLQYHWGFDKDVCVLAHKQYWNLRVNLLIDKVNLPRCLAELVVSYLKLQE